MAVGDARVTEPNPSPVKAQNDGWEWFWDHWSMVEQDWRNRRQRYQKFYAMLVAKAHGNPTPYNAKLRSRLVQQQVNTHQAFLLTAMLPSFPYVFAETVEPYRTFPNLAIESEATEEINARLRRAKFYSNMNAWIRSANMNGVGVLKMVNGNMRVVDASNFAWDLSCNGDVRNDAGFVIERITDINLQTVYALWKDGIFNKITGEKFKRLMELTSMPDDTGDYNADKEYRYRERLYRTSPRIWGQGMHRRIEIMEITTPSRRMWVNRDTQIVIGDRTNTDGFINYYVCQTFPENNEVQGWAIPEILEDIQEEMNANLAQSVDNASLSSNVLVKLRRNSGLDPFNMRVQPGKVFPVNDMDDLDFFQPQFNGRELYNQRGNLQLEADRLTGIMAHTRGEAGPASMKATVANQINTNVNVRLNATANTIIDGPFRDLINDFMRASANDPTPVKVTQLEWDAIRSIINKGEMEMAPNPEAYVGNQMAKSQQFLNLLQILAGAKMIGPRGASALAQETINIIGMRDPERVTQDMAQAMMQDVMAAQAKLPGGQMGAGDAGAGGGLPQVQSQAQGMAAGQPLLPAGIQP
jgi:hypothetical protein